MVLVCARLRKSTRGPPLPTKATFSVTLEPRFVATSTLWYTSRFVHRSARWPKAVCATATNCLVQVIERNEMITKCGCPIGCLGCLYFTPPPPPPPPRPPTADRRPPTTNHQPPTNQPPIVGPCVWSSCQHVCSFFSAHRTLTLQT